MPTLRKTKVPRRHHVIPAHLLGQFASPETLKRRWRERAVWVYQKGKQTAQASVESLCLENGYFDVLEEDGTYSAAYETELNETVEIPFNTVLSVIENPLYVPNREDALIVYRYIANMFTRSKQRRIASKANRTEIDALYEKVTNDHSKVRLLAAIYSLKLRRRVFLEEVEEGMREVMRRLSLDERKHSSDFVESMDSFDADIVRMLDGRPYGLLNAPARKHFIIGDNPILTRTPHGNYLVVGDGFNKPNMHVLMPISPRSCLQIGLYGDFSRTITSEEVDRINFDIISLCHRAIYSCEKDEQIRAPVDRSAGTRKYKRNAFVTPPLTEGAVVHFPRKDLVRDRSSCGN